MTHEQAKSELMQIYMSLSEEKKQAIDVLMAQADENIPQDHDGCKDCKHEDKSEDEKPCVKCKQNYLDMWERKRPDKLEQDPKTGHWFVDERPESDREIICSNCEQPIFKYHKMDFDYRPKYCPNCGKKMGVSE